MRAATAVVLVIGVCLAAAGCGRRAVSVGGEAAPVPGEPQPVTPEPESTAPTGPTAPAPQQPAPAPSSGKLAVGALCDFQHELQPLSMRLNPSASACDSRLCLYTGMEVARCTDFCSVDADCPAPSPDCPSGFICVARFAVGPPACCKLCICNSALHPAERKDLFSCRDRQCSFTAAED